MTFDRTFSLSHQNWLALEMGNKMKSSIQLVNSIIGLEKELTIVDSLKYIKIIKRTAEQDQSGSSMNNNDCESEIIIRNNKPIDCGMVDESNCNPVEIQNFRNYLERICVLY